MYESLLVSFNVEVGEGASVGDGDGLSGIEVGGRGQAEMLSVFSLGGLGRGINEVKFSGVAGKGCDGARRCLSTFVVSTFETGCFRINC